MNDKLSSNYQFAIRQHGHMFPDYFTGTTGLQLNLYLHSENTVGEVIQFLNEEIELYYDSLQFIAEQKGYNPTFLEEKLDNFISYLKANNELDTIFSSSLPSPEEMSPEDEFAEIAPFIFSLEFEEED